MNTENLPSLAPTNFSEAWSFAKMAASSGLVPKAYQGKPEDIVLCIQFGYEVGLQPLQALQGIAVINGRPSLWGDALLALIMSNPLCESIDETWDEATWVATCTAKRKGYKNVMVRSFSWDDAKRAGLSEKPIWQKYPRRMLQYRARGFCLRDLFPDLLKGMISREEAEDIDVPVQDTAPGPVTVTKDKKNVPVEDPEPVPTATTTPVPDSDQPFNGLPGCLEALAEIDNWTHLVNWWRKHAAWFAENLTVEEQVRLTDACADRKALIVTHD